MISSKIKIGWRSLIIFTISAFLYLFSSTVQALEISVEPAASTIGENETVQLDIYVNSSISLISMGVKVSFNPAVLTVVSADKNTDFINGFMMDEDGDPGTTSDQYTNPPVETDNTSGSVTMLGGRFIGTSTTGLSGKVLLGTIVFEGVSFGSSNITVDLGRYHPEHPVETYNNFVNIDGSVDEPTNLGILGSITVTTSPTDTDNDGILDDGDNSGTAGDNPCAGGQTEDCDDNCPAIPNPAQEDINNNGVGDICETLITVPALTGMVQADAESSIVAAGFVIGTITSQPSSTVPYGNVISQSPSAGVGVISGSAIDLVISSGPVLISVPEVTGMTQAEAETSIVSSGLVVGTVSMDNSSTVPVGSVINQNPAAGESVPENSSVNLVVSLGPIIVIVPNLEGMSADNAEAAIISAGLTVGIITYENSDTVPEGMVISQIPANGENISEGTPVDITISLGPLMITVPNVVGLSLSSAETAIIDADLSVGIISPELGANEQYDKVISQIPEAGTEVSEGTEVDLEFSVIDIETLVVFQEDFETGGPDWQISNGVWEVGTPTSGPGNAFTGTQCAGTVLGGNYPNNTYSRLISPIVILPIVSGDEEIHLRFWQYFSIYAYDVSYSQDRGYVQISTYDEVDGWSAWQSVGTLLQDYSQGWSFNSVDLTVYEGQKVRIAFYQTADEQDVSTGWYIDDVQIVSKVPEFDGTFESDWGDWHADRGVWQIGDGTRTGGDGTRMVGTVIGGNYPNYTDSRLISPSITLPSASGDEEVHLRFWQSFSIYAYDVSYSQDRGYVQISTYDEVDGWSAWQSVGTLLQDYSQGWS
ncbi:MAG: PASTA domain-containing protein, partial [Desulfobacteraceae bacterium]